MSDAEGASEHIQSLDNIIATLGALDRKDQRGEEILKAALTLRDTSGRERKDVLRTMASTWHVVRSERVEGKWRPRPVAALATDVQAAVCEAASQWERSGVAERRCAKRAKTAGATEHANAAVVASASAPASDRICELTESSLDVMSLRRLGSDVFEATLRSGEVRVMDSQILSTLPQGEARRATLEVRETMAKAKASAAPKARAREEPVTSPKPAAKKQKAGVDLVDIGKRVTEQGLGDHGARSSSEREVGLELLPTRLATGSQDFLGQGLEQDRDSLEWLQSRQDNPRCVTLLRQMLEWSGATLGRGEMRALANSQGIRISRDARHSLEFLREAVRQHFRAAISQEKGRLSCFQFRVLHGASEHMLPGTSGETRVIEIADVADLPGLQQFQRQRSDMPDDLKQAILRVAGGCLASKKTSQELARLLNVKPQGSVQYNAAEKGRPAERYVQFALSLTFAMLRRECFRRVRAWATLTATSGALQGTLVRTPQTTLELANMLRNPSSKLRCPFGADFEKADSRGGRLDGSCRVPLWLALIELHSDGYRYGVQSERHLPYVFDKVVDLLIAKRSARGATSLGATEHLIVVPDDLTRALMTNPVFTHKVATHDVLSYAMKNPAEHLRTISSAELKRGDAIAQCVLMPSAAAALIAKDFFDFVLQHNLAHTMASMSPEQITIIALFLGHLRRKPPQRVHISERLDLLQRKVSYTPATEIVSPEIPHFLRFELEQSGAAARAHSSTPTIQAPVICQLCGAGFLSPKDLWAHAAKEHHSWAEARKRLIFEVQRRTSVPLHPPEKRRLANNFMHDLLYSYPGRNTVRPGECTMRQIVACAVCAIKDWIDDFYPCYLWKDAPSSAQAGATEHGSDHDTDDEDTHTGSPPKGIQLRDEHGFCYFGPPERIHAHLNVDSYVPVVPLAPLEELHASSVQHPSYPAMRWLLHTRRVPLLSSEGAAIARESADGAPGAPARGAPEHATPACAGIGDAEKPAWICHHCACHLCSPQPRMPPQALANWNWGGREHPKYQNLTMATQSLLGLGKLIMRFSAELSKFFDFLLFLKMVTN